MFAELAARTCRRSVYSHITINPSAFQHGSLYDLLHNETMPLEGEIALQMLKDISQGCRFLHAANPQVIHGDLKSSVGTIVLWVLQNRYNNSVCL